MHVQHSNPGTSTVGHNGHQWEALRDGIFNVPDDVGLELLARPGWTRYMGEAPYQVASASAAAEENLPPPPAAPPAEDIDWFEKGREAHVTAVATGATRSAPEGKHPASREARDFFRGWDSVAVPPE